MMVENSGMMRRSARSSEAKERGNSSKAQSGDDFEKKLPQHGGFSARVVPPPPPGYRIQGSDKDAMLEDYAASSKVPREPSRKIIHPPSIRVSRTDPELNKQPLNHAAPHPEPTTATQGKSVRRHKGPATSQKGYPPTQKGLVIKSENQGTKGRIRARGELGPAALSAEPATHGKSVRRHSEQKGYRPQQASKPVSLTVQPAEQMKAATRGPMGASHTSHRKSAPVQSPVEQRAVEKSVKARDPSKGKPQIQAVQSASLIAQSPSASAPLRARPVSSQSRRKDGATKKESQQARQPTRQVSTGDRKPSSVQQRSNANVLLGPTYDVDEPKIDANDKGSESDSSAPESGVIAENQPWNGIDASLQEATSEQSTRMATASPKLENVEKISRQRSLRDSEAIRKRTVPREEKSNKDEGQSFRVRSQDTYRGDNRLDNMEDIKLAQEALNSVMDMLIPSTPSGTDAFSMPSVATTNIDTDELMSESTSTQLTQDRIALAEAALQNFMDVLQQDLERSVQASARGDIPVAVNDEKERSSVSIKIRLLDLFRWSLSPNVDAEEKIRYLEQERQRMTRQKDQELRGLIKTDEAVKRERLRQSREAEAQRHRIHQLEEDIGFASTTSSRDQPGGNAQNEGSHLNQLIILLSRTGDSVGIFKDDEEGSPNRRQERLRKLSNENEKRTQGPPSWAALGGRPVVTRDESLIDLNSLSRRQDRRSEPTRSAWTELGGKQVVTTDKPIIDEQVSEEHQPTLQNRRNASDLSNHLTASHVAEEDTRPKPPPSLSSSSYSRVSTDPSWGDRRHSGSSKDQSETSAILANAATAAAALTLGERSPTSESSVSSSNEDETPVSSLGHTTGSMPSWAAFGGRPIVMSNSESSQFTDNDRHSPEPNLLPSSFNEEDEIYGGSDEGSFEASLPLFRSQSQQDFGITPPAAPVSADTPSTHDDEPSTIPKLKPYSFFRATTDRQARSPDEKPLLNQTDVISVGSAGDIHRHVGTIQYLEDRSMVSRQSSALSLDPELKGDDQHVPPVNRRWTDAGRRRSLGSSVKSSLKGIRNMVSARGCRDRFGPRRVKMASSRDCLLHEGEGIFDSTPVLDMN